MHYLILNLLVICSLSLYAANENALLQEQAMIAAHPLVTQLKDLIYHAGSAEAMQQYKAQLKGAEYQVLQKVRDAVDAYDTGITVAYDIHKDTCINTLMSELLRVAASSEVQWDHKKLKPIAHDYLLDVKTWDRQTYNRVDTLLSFLRNHGELGWRHFQHFRKEMNTKPFIERKGYLDPINDRIEDLKKTIKDIDHERTLEAHRKNHLYPLGLVDASATVDADDAEALDAEFQEWLQQQNAASAEGHLNTQE